MNKYGKNHCRELPPCRVCGLDGGLRMMTENPEQYFIVCQVCGFRTKKFTTRAGATRSWGGSKKKEA